VLYSAFSSTSFNSIYDTLTDTYQPAIWLIFAIIVLRDPAAQGLHLQAADANLIEVLQQKHKQL
jgi:hypothetical protein